MIRKVIHIDEDKCNGCGACANACHEGAIAMVDGKARLMRDDYCDGLGNCLPACPTGAITFVEREAAAYDAEAVAKHMEQTGKKVSGSGALQENAPIHGFTGCPGTRSRMIDRERQEAAEDSGSRKNAESQLSQWPVQIKLVPVQAPYFQNASLLIAADCTAYAFAEFHQKFIRGHITLIGCPKLDETDYAEKLTEIISRNEIKSVKVVRMEVPCCGGIENAVKTALQRSGKMIPWQVVVISTDGRILED